MSNDDLWGDLPEADNATEPATLLRQQASLLGSKTGNVLAGIVTRPKTATLQLGALTEAFGVKEERVELRFSIRCSALDNYTFHVLTLNYPLLTIFPAIIHDEVTGQEHLCKSEDDLRVALHRIFSSPQLRRVISALLREARALPC